MIRTSPATIRRAAAVVLAAAVLSFSNQRASAQTSVDLFAGTLGATTQLSTNPLTASGPFGPGYNGTVTLNASVNNILSEGFSPNGTGSNSFFINQTGIATLGGTTVATKLFGGILTANTTYAFTLTSSTAAAVSLLGSFQVALYNGDPATATPFVNTATGTGLSGVVNLLGLFNATNQNATFNFTTPANYNAATGLGLKFTGNLPVNAAAGSLVFNSASINQVPEPHTVVAMLLGAGGLVVLRLRRRLHAA